MADTEMTAEQALKDAEGLDFKQVWAIVSKMAAKIDNLSDTVGIIVNNQGKMIEEMFSANVWDKFDVYGYEFTKEGSIKLRENGMIIAQVDIFLENGKYAMAVEVKSTLTNDWVDDHLERMDKIRAYMDSHNDERILVGAVAGSIVPENVRRYAEKHGLYVLLQNGENISVAEYPKKFKGKEW
jgi:hypothetical protein